MDPRETVIAWTPASEPNNPTAGQVRLFPFGDIPREWRCTSGAAYVRVRSFQGLHMRHYLMSEALGMILGDGIDPFVVHEAFSAFPEWLDALPADVRLCSRPAPAPPDPQPWPGLPPAA